MNQKRKDPMMQFLESLSGEQLGAFNEVLVESTLPDEDLVAQTKRRVAKMLRMPKVGDELAELIGYDWVEIRVLAVHNDGTITVEEPGLPTNDPQRVRRGLASHFTRPEEIAFAP